MPVSAFSMVTLEAPMCVLKALPAAVRHSTPLSIRCMCCYSAKAESPKSIQRCPVLPLICCSFLVICHGTRCVSTNTDTQADDVRAWGYPCGSEDGRVVFLASICPLDEEDAVGEGHARVLEPMALVVGVVEDALVDGDVAIEPASGPADVLKVAIDETNDTALWVLTDWSRVGHTRFCILY